MVELDVWKVEWCPTYEQSVVILKDDEGKQFFPIHIVEEDAQTIAFLLNRKSREPYKKTCIFSQLLENVNVKILSVEIQKTSYGDIQAKVLYCDRDRSYAIVDNPSAAIELAMSCRIPLTIRESLVVTESTDQQYCGRHLCSYECIQQFA